MQGRDTHLRAYIALLIILLLACGFVYEMYVVFARQAPQVSTLQQYPAELPPLRPQDAADQQQPFQYLVSYTDTGAHPATLEMKVGETVRFINESSEPISITGSGESTPLAHGAYTQWTAAKKGTVNFKVGSSTVTTIAS